VEGVVAGELQNKRRLSIASNHACEISNLARANGIQRIAFLFSAKRAFC
jgi:hypothetical protein